MKAFNLLTNEEHHFDEHTTPEWACAYGYCEEHCLMSALFAAAQDMRLEEFYKTLPFTYGARSLACGDWAAARTLQVGDTVTRNGKNWGVTRIKSGVARLENGQWVGLGEPVEEKTA